jgi:branched-chain amino acid transport system ATP-binding protein
VAAAGGLSRGRWRRGAKAASLPAITRGATFMVIKHNMEFVMNLCTRVIVLAEGAIIAKGTPEQPRADQTVIDAYLGG